jgi:hypothetical protein
MRLRRCRGDAYRELVESGTMTEQAPDPAPRATGQIVFGAAVILLGIAMLTDPREGWGIYLPDGWWPLFVILFGVARLVDPGQSHGRPRSRSSGVWLVSIGIWGLISETRLFGFGYSTSWPLLVILLGAVIVSRALRPPEARRLREN